MNDCDSAIGAVSGTDALGWGRLGGAEATRGRARAGGAGIGQDPVRGGQGPGTGRAGRGHSGWLRPAHCPAHFKLGRPGRLPFSAAARSW